MDFHIAPTRRFGLSVTITRSYKAFCFGCPRILDIFWTRNFGVSIHRRYKRQFDGDAA